MIFERYPVSSRNSSHFAISSSCGNSTSTRSSSPLRALDFGRPGEKSAADMAYLITDPTVAFRFQCRRSHGGDRSAAIPLVSVGTSDPVRRLTRIGNNRIGNNRIGRKRPTLEDARGLHHIPGNRGESRVRWPVVRTPRKERQTWRTDSI